MKFSGALISAPPFFLFSFFARLELRLSWRGAGWLLDSWRGVVPERILSFRTNAAGFRLIKYCYKARLLWFQAAGQMGEEKKLQAGKVRLTAAPKGDGLRAEGPLLLV